MDKNLEQFLTDISCAITYHGVSALIRTHFLFVNEVKGFIEATNYEESYKIRLLKHNKKWSCYLVIEDRSKCIWEIEKQNDGNYSVPVISVA